MEQLIILGLESYWALIACLINIIFALLALFRTSMTLVYRIFFFICLSSVVWNLGDFMIYLTGKRFWFYFSLIGGGMIPAFMLHFISAFVRSEQKTSPLIVAVYVLFGLLSLSSPLAMFDAGIRSFVDGFAWNVCYLVLLVPIFLWSIATVIRTMRRANDEEKNRLRYVLVAIVVGVFTGITDLVQILGVPILPLGHFGTAVYSSVLAIGIFRHRTAYDVLAQMRMKVAILSEMTAGIAHEIRNPLSSIKGATRLLSDKLKNREDPQCREYLDIMTEEIERLNSILVNFQSLAKPITIKKESVSINDVIRKTVKLAEIDALNISIRLELSAAIPTVQADASSMKQIFLNLIKNAGEACASDCELIIRTAYVAPWVRISFSDNGPGMAEEIIDRVFEPFFTTKVSGMGVGLAISRRIVEAHNGRIEVKNILPKGTEFSILLPVGG
ncbi:MAG TPA: ATP-binding protein [Dissulfurispiraceae bacterium]|nr:ATP-binding protein [Dissulfurispiraceae bacterium]